MTDDDDPHISIQGAGDAVVHVLGMHDTRRLFYRSQPLLAMSRAVCAHASCTLLTNHVATLAVTP
jgi:hypothetical protein